MPETIILQGDGYTIARTDDAGTAIPYGPADREDGARNHGFLDLRDRPELVRRIPEAQGSAGMQALLREVNAPGFRFMSLGCERAIFPRQSGRREDPNYLCGGYIQVAYRDSVLNAAPDRLIALAQRLLSGIGASSEHHIGFTMIVEPLRSFFGDANRYALMIKPLGYGNSRVVARSAWEHAARSIASGFAGLPRGHLPQT